MYSHVNWSPQSWLSHIIDITDILTWVTPTRISLFIADAPRTISTADEPFPALIKPEASRASTSFMSYFLAFEPEIKKRDWHSAHGFFLVPLRADLSYLVEWKWQQIQVDLTNLDFGKYYIMAYLRGQLQNTRKIITDKLISKLSKHQQTEIRL